MEAPRRTPSRPAAAAFAAAVFLAAAALPARAQMPFGPVTARSLALGGAAVGLTPDVAGAVDNPALAPDKEFAFALTAGLVTRESGDFLAPLNAVVGNDPLKLATGAQPQNFADVVAALRTLGDPGNGILGNGNVSIAAAHKGWELSSTDRAYSGVFVRADLVHTALGANPATSIAFNTSALVSNGLELKDVALAKSFSFLEGAISVGGAVHAPQQALHAMQAQVVGQFGQVILVAAAHVEERQGMGAGVGLDQALGQGLRVGQHLHPHPRGLPAGHGNPPHPADW